MLESNKKKKTQSFGGFELEHILEDDEKQKVLLKDVENHITEIKGQLRSGTKPEEFDKLGLLLHGYSALLKIVSRANIK